jgi:hypothetical protein
MKWLRHRIRRPENLPIPESSPRQFNAAYPVPDPSQHSLDMDPPRRPGLLAPNQTAVRRICYIWFWILIVIMVITNTVVNIIQGF